MYKYSSRNNKLNNAREYPYSMPWHKLKREINTTSTIYLSLGIGCGGGGSGGGGGDGGDDGGGSDGSGTYIKMFSFLQ